ncbi:MAG: AAA family ATPase, partial [Gemmatimonadota bacterium]
EGFTVEETLDEGPTSTVYRARKDGAERTVVIKTLTDAYPSARAVARMEHEYDIGATVQSPHVVSYYDLLPHGSSYALILEDFGATDARALVTGRAEPPGLGEFLRVARQVALALGDLHSREIVHRDVSPGNVLWNRETGEVKLADFGLATRIPRSREAVVHPTHLQGTLAYISPEQTGRMNRAVDYRTDFYSFGATLWFFLTGSPPFLETDPMALIHAHIAKAPPHLTALRGDLPDVVAELVHRLLAKTSEERYQSAAGIVADLDRCIETLSDGGAIPTFQLGTQDAGRKFRISEKLYGREEEVAGLLRTFGTAARGPVHLLLVRGLSGIGKSMLVNEVHKPMVARRAYFAEGKYDQLGMTDPLSAILQALTDLTRQILTEDEENIAEWRSRALSAVGDGARVLTNLIPELSELLGEQPELLKLGAVEARERFERTLLRFLQAAAAPAHPLVLFLDDLQWADPASLRVLQQLLTSPDTRNTLVICAYRDNEVSPSHPFALALGEIESRGVGTSRYTLGPLPLDALQAFIGDSLERGTTEVNRSPKPCWRRPAVTPSMSPSSSTVSRTRG